MRDARPTRVGKSLMTKSSTARSPVVRDINVDQHLRASGRKSAEDGRTDAKPPHLGEGAVRRGQKKIKKMLDKVERLWYTKITKGKENPTNPRGEQSLSPQMGWR